MQPWALSALSKGKLSKSQGPYPGSPTVWLKENEGIKRVWNITAILYKDENLTCHNSSSLRCNKLLIL